MKDESDDNNGRKLLEPGEMFGDYTVEKLLGKGGMGAVYLVRAPDGGRYAVKLMFPDIAKKNSEFRKRFAREAEFAMKLRHKNLIQVYDVGEDPDTGYCYIIMDYVPGGNVKDRLREHGAFPVAEAVSITTQIAVALELAHRHGVIHRDIKPDNIMFDADGTPKLADLGVAKFSDDTHDTTVTSTGMILGTPAYMAPEQMMDSHHIDARADIYALGIVFYEMLTGRRPTEGSTAMELLAKAVKGEKLPDVRTMRAEVSAAIAYVLSLMCAPKPEGRPATALITAELLQKAATGRLTLPKKPPCATDAKRAKRQFPLIAGIVGVFVLGVAAFGWHAWHKRAKATATPPVANTTETTDAPPVSSTTGKTDVPSAAVEHLKPLTFDLGGGLKMEMMGCPAGSFSMGFLYGPEEFKSHQVRISRPFWMAKFLMTIEQWNRFMPPREIGPIVKALGGLKVPVPNVTRGEVEQLCEIMTRKFRSVLPYGYVFRLPTEAEWEYACRANAGPDDPYRKPRDLTDEEDSSIAIRTAMKISQLKNAGVAVDVKKTWLIPGGMVGQKKPNAWGLYDMIGNVDELMFDLLPKKSPSGVEQKPGASLRGQDYRDATDPLAWTKDGFPVSITRCSLSPRQGWGSVKKCLFWTQRVPCVGFRLIVGPDLLKERGLSLPKSTEGGNSADSSSSSSAAEAELPKETTPRPPPLVLDLGGSVKMEMVGCPGGKFWMGVHHQKNPLDKGHVVEITRSFWFGKYPVTVEQWERLMPRAEPPPGVQRKDIDPKLPVQLFWNGTMGLTGASAEEFMAKLTRMFERQLPRGYKFRFPSEAEWEYALKANSRNTDDPYVQPWRASGQVLAETYVLGSDSRDYWVPRGIASRIYENRNWFIGPYVPVGSKKPNGWGIYDMGGITSEPMLDSWVTTKSEWYAESNPWKRLCNVRARFPRVTEDGVRDPLAFEEDRKGATRLRWVRQGFSDSLVRNPPKETPISSRHALRYWFDAKEQGLGDPRAVMLRLVAGPDLLKERGITPPMPEVSTQGTSRGDSKRPAPLVLDLGGGVKMEMLHVAPGSFMMGGQGAGPVHKVTLTKGFWLGKCEVTQAQWAHVVGNNPSALKNGDHPVENVSWNDCQMFVKKVNALLGGDVVRLPTEAEWEYACRAGSETDFGGTGNLDDMGWYGENSGGRTHPVGQKRANAWGFHDMHGNVWEWCSDWNGGYADGDVSDPAGPSVGTKKMKRGGSMWSPPNRSGSSIKGSDPISVRMKDTGFRLVASPERMAEKQPAQSDSAAAGEARTIVVFPRADTESARWKKRAPWRYTTKMPPADWATPGFRDGNWRRTNKPVGFGKKANIMNITEKWTTKDIWLRRHFDWKNAKVLAVTLEMFHDDDVEIYLNGTSILEKGGSTRAWELFSVPEDRFLSAVKEGDNVLAVKVHDVSGARYFDCGLTVKVEDSK